MFKLVSLFCILLSSSSLIASEDKILKCNVCLGSYKSDCANGVQSAYATQNCVWPVTLTPIEKSAKKSETDSIDPSTMDISCVVLKLNDTEKMTQNIQRGCAFVYKNLGTCKFILEKIPGVLECTSCTKDLCN